MCDVERGRGYGGLLNVIAVCIRDHVVELLHHHSPYVDSAQKTEVFNKDRTQN